MFNPLARITLLVLILTVSTVGAQPTRSSDDSEAPDGMPRYGAKYIRTSQPYYTAFPNIPTPKVDFRKITNPDGTEEYVHVLTGAGPFPSLPDLAANAPPLRKVRYEQVRDGLTYLARVNVHVPYRVDYPWTFGVRHEYAKMTSAVYWVGAELEDSPTKRVRWYETRVRRFKELELWTLIRVINGNEPPQKLDSARFARLQAEAELLKLLAEVEQTGAVPVPFPMALPHSPGAARPDAHEPNIVGVRPTYTAFPDLKPGTAEMKTGITPDGKTLRVIDSEPLPLLPILPTDATQLRRVKHEQVLEGLVYLHQVDELIRSGNWISMFFYEYIETASDTYRRAANLEPSLAARVPWYEARVRKLKEFESFTEIRVRKGIDAPQRLDVVRFWRLRAEADLLVLLAEVKKLDPGSNPPVKREAFEFKGTRPFFTAFPDLKPPILEKQKVEDSDEANPSFGVLEKEVVPLPPLPVLSADAAPLRKVKFEQLRAGLSFLNRVKQIIQIDHWTSQFFHEYLDLIAGTYRIGAELEGTPTQRVPWYEAGMSKLKGFEMFTEARVKEGNDPPHQLALVRIQRLQVEAELLELKAGAAAPTVTPIPLYYWQPDCPRSRSGPLWRPFHRR